MTASSHRPFPVNSDQDSSRQPHSPAAALAAVLALATPSATQAALEGEAAGGESALTVPAILATPTGDAPRSLVDLIVGGKFRVGSEPITAASITELVKAHPERLELRLIRAALLLDEARKNGTAPDLKQLLADLGEALKLFEEGKQPFTLGGGGAPFVASEAPVTIAQPLVAGPAFVLYAKMLRHHALAGVGCAGFQACAANLYRKESLLAPTEYR